MQSRPVLVFLGVLVLFFAWSEIGFLAKMQMTRENRKLVENKVNELKKEKEKLSSDISKLSTEDGVEESIRTKFGFAKDGEGVIVIVDDRSAPEVPSEDSGGFWSFLTNWFK